jgi:hypothetical protein
LGLRRKARITSSSASAAKKPISGAIHRPVRILVAWLQSTPAVPPREPALMIWLAKPTPSTDPISVCEELLGRPTYQVPRFHSTAASSNAKIIANPPADPTLRIRSTGSSVMIE